MTLAGDWRKVAVTKDPEFVTGDRRRSLAPDAGTKDSGSDAAHAIRR